jgi:RNA polymerase sigma-70 factor (ECF subfamily)
MQPEPDNDNTELIAAARSGDAAATSELMHRHLPALRAYLRARGGAEFRARESESDLAQSACLVALQNLDKFEWRGRGSFLAWLCALAENVVRNHRHYNLAEKRDPRREHRGDSSELRLSQAYASIATPSRHAAAREQIERFEAALDQIPAAQRDVVVWSRIVGLSHAEIAARLGKTEVAIRTMLSRGLVRLASLLES